jgi:hypothetical protein
MTLSELIELYVTFKRSLGLIYRSEAQVLQAFCRAIGDCHVVECFPVRYALISMAQVP